MDKALLREKYRDIRKNINADVSKNLLNWDVFKNAKTVFTYVSTKNEPDTQKILNSGKDILIPVTFKDMGIIKPCVYYGQENLIKGTYGIYEPKTITVFEKENIDLVIIPGLCFNEKGYRVGYGGGYYDKFLSDYTGIKIGLCYEQCITKYDFQKDYDVKVDYIITEERIIKV